MVGHRLVTLGSLIGVCMLSGSVVMGAPPAVGPTAPPVSKIANVLPAVYLSAVKHVAPPVRVQGVQAVMNRVPTSYSTGPLGVELTLSNRSAAPVSQVKVSLTYPAKAGGNLTVEGVLDVPANGTATTTLVEPDGVLQSCSDKKYTAKLDGTGSIDALIRHITVHPNCSNKGTLQNPWLKTTSPDNVSSAKEKTAWVDELHFQGGLLKFEEALVCHQVFNIEAQAGNRTTKTADGMGFTGHTPDGTLVANSVFKLKSNQVLPITVSGSYIGEVGTATFKLTEAYPNLGSAIVNQGITLEISRSCAVAMTLEPGGDPR
jgi:hypothetical protein